MRVRIRLNGCDDDTRVATHITLKQYAFLIKIQEKLNARSDCACKPRMYISIMDKNKKNDDFINKVFVAKESENDNPADQTNQDSEQKSSPQE